MSTKRALVLAGGGLKVAYQAGALQVLLDEVDDEDLKFDFVDGASGGIFNLAMWCEGLTGREIADHWRRLSPGRYLWLRIGWPFFSFRRFRKNVFSDWGIDPFDIRRGKDATFNFFDVKRQALVIRRAAEMTEELLCACVALPGWFPAVKAEGTTYVDAVFVTDGNLEQVLADGTTELWVIWTVSRKGRLGRWPGGTFFQTVEQTANGRLKQVERRIERSNAAGTGGEFGQRVDMRILYGEVPSGYLFVFTRGQLQRAVEQGVRETRAVVPSQRFPVEGGRQPDLSSPDALHGGAGGRRPVGEHDGALEAQRRRDDANCRHRCVRPRGRTSRTTYRNRPV